MIYQKATHGLTEAWSAGEYKHYSRTQLKRVTKEMGPTLSRLTFDLRNELLNG